MKFIWFAALLLVSFSASAATAPQQTQILPPYGPMYPCTNGTGTAITSVTTSATVVCAAANSYRYFWRIANTAASGTLYCTDDGSTPSATNADFTVSPGTFYTSSPQYVSTMPISCVGSATVSILAYSIQGSNVP